MKIINTINCTQVCILVDRLAHFMHIQSSPGGSPLGEYLPHGDTVAPHVRGGGVLAVSEGLHGRPAHNTRTKQHFVCENLCTYSMFETTIKYRIVRTCVYYHNIFPIFCRAISASSWQLGIQW